MFVGDSAHIVSPFGARGGNSAIQDVDNLAWKLAAVLSGLAPESLLLSYDDERIRAADENIAHSTRATNFMTPKSPLERMLREEVIALAHEMDFARKLINSGRLSTPCSLSGLPLQTPPEQALVDSGVPMVEPGSPLKDAPLRLYGKDAWLLNMLGEKFVLLSFDRRPSIEVCEIPHLHVDSAGEGPLQDLAGLAFARYGRGLTYLIRPDQHLAAIFARPSPEKIILARDRSLGRLGIGEHA